MFSSHRVRDLEIQVAELKRTVADLTRLIDDERIQSVIHNVFDHQISDKIATMIADAIDEELDTLYVDVSTTLSRHGKYR